MSDEYECKDIDDDVYCRKLLGENKKLRDALKFYANKENWYQSDGNWYEEVGCDTSPIGSHRVSGKRARQCLEELDNE